MGIGNTMIKYSSFLHLLEEQASRNPDAPAIIRDLQGRPAAVSWSDLQAMVLSKSDELRSCGRKRPGILCDGSLACVVTVFACAAAGMQSVLLDPMLPDEALQAQILAADADMLWIPEELADDVDLKIPDSGNAVPPSVENEPARILFFTSGTTAMSKAVVLTERSLLASAWNGSSMLPLSQQDILLCVLPLNHVFGFVCSLLWGMTCGAAVALGRGIRHFADDFVYFSPTAVSVIPLLLEFMIRQDAFNPELRTILVGAGDCPRPLMDTVLSRGIRLCFGYGLTETSSGVAISTGGDPYALEICPDDTVTIAPDGEILISAPTCMMQGYYRHPEDTAQVLKGGILHTGDLGFLDENGCLHVTGRKKEMIVLSDGTKLFLPEYETQLGAVLKNRDFAVIELNSSPVLVIAGDPSEKTQILETLKPVMALRPRGQQLRDILFTGAPLPRTATGKVKRLELAEQFKK